MKESVNITFNDTKLPSIQIEDATEKLKFKNLSDLDSDNDDTQPEVGSNDNNDNNDDIHCDCGGNINDNRESTSTGEESLRQYDNNLGGDN